MRGQRETKESQTEETEGRDREERQKVGTGRDKGEPDRRDGG